VGTNTIPQAVPNTIIPSTDHNSLRTALVGDHVPRSTGGAPVTLSGSVGTSSFRWLLGYIQKIFIGTAAQNISLEGDGSDLVIKVGGVENLRMYVGEPALPTGMITAYSGDAAPSGWLLCDGVEVSRTTYATLFAAVGTRYGHGNTTTTFNIPDFRGRFLRGTALGSLAVDPDSGSRTAMNAGGATGNNVGSIQPDEFRSHKHDTGAHLDGYTVPFSGAGTNDAIQAGTERDTGLTGGNETRPKNAYVNYIIKI